MTDLPARLQEALGDAYHLDRELGGGGMSRLFIATERSLNRQVVVKVLPPELTSEVSAARFKQEIEVAAKLQHPHIVPILGAGASNELLYYIMPYVRGESLRHRIVASGRLPVDDAVRILSEVARALGYAHRQGIVHRDIKPENILLEDGQAVLADFGVARAIVAARTTDVSADESWPEKITGTGMAVGTPTYMAPEQAAGDSNVDARADLYALGVVGYEMLTGQHPFAATSAQKMIVAHLTLPAPPVAKLRPETSAAVSAAIARALAKEPEQRFGSAEEFRGALEGVAPRKRASRRLALTVGGAIAAVLVAIAVGYARRSSATTLDPNLVAIAPFDVEDVSLKLWHEGMVDVLSRNLDGAGPLQTVSPSLVIRRWKGRADKESAVALGLATGARLAVFGTLIRAGQDSVSASATVMDARSGKVLGEVTRGEAIARMGRLADSLTIGLLRELGKSRTLAFTQISSVGTTSLPALKAFLQGEQFYRHSVWDSAITYYDRALASDSQFSIALVHEGEALGWKLNESSDAFLERAGRFNRGLSPRDSVLIEASATVALFFDTASSDSTKAVMQRRLFATLKEAVRRYPNDPELWEQLGDAQVHLARGSGFEIEGAEALRSFDRAIALDSNFSPPYRHAAMLRFHLSTSEGRRYLEAYLAHIPSGDASDGILLAYRATDPVAISTRQLETLADSASEDAIATAFDLLREWPDSNETALRLVRARVRRKMISHPEDSIKDASLLAWFASSRGHATEALRAEPSARNKLELASLGLFDPSVVDTLLASATVDVRSSAAIAYMGLRHDTLAMRRRVEQVRNRSRNESAEDQRTLLYYEALMQAYTELARGDTTAALRDLSTLPDSFCPLCGWPALPLTRARILSALGKFAEADKVLDEVGIAEGVTATFFELEHGRIAEKRKDKVRARVAYAYVADMWRNGDPPFQGYVEEAKAGLRRLSVESVGMPIPIQSQTTAH